MSLINENFLKLSDNYLFAEIARRVSEYKLSKPESKLVRLGIGDVTRALPQVCVEAMHKAVDEMGDAASFRGYGPEQGYDFLRKAIIANDFAPRGVELDADEVFISDGAKSDCGNIGDILSPYCRVAVTDPVYPVYIDSNMMSGRELVLLRADEKAAFTPALPETRPDVIYLCYPNNPTGIALNRDQLKLWVDYARENGSIIIFDAAYEAFIQEDGIPHSIYEIAGAKEVAIEIRSFSKTAGFTGVRAGCTIVPKAIRLRSDDGRTISLNALWNRRQCTKFNGTSYISQRAAEAIYSPEGKSQTKAIIAYYMRNASLMRERLQKLGLQVYGGVNAPYLWVKCPASMGSWEFFDLLLNRLEIVTTPGAGFGSAGEGFIRITAFGNYEDCVEAMDRLSDYLK
ncbi:MAG: LL-diaminopimelate aminotransferase [Rikenellaceae bacterium]|nr:LL-diaminopimelate aminotransferase [Rikenellaceae bacterium]